MKGKEERQGKRKKARGLFCPFPVAEA